VHDFEPGIEPSGLFWTIPFASSSIDVDEEDGRARLRARDLAVSDFHDFFNAISPSPSSQPARASFDTRWHGGGARTKINDATFGFAGQFVAGTATISFAVSAAGGVVYRSVADGQLTVSGGVGRERNGVFFAQGDGGDDGQQAGNWEGRYRLN
jgi:hypothetical protein